MKKLSLEAEKIMIERFGKDTVVAFSNKMKHMENNPTIAIAGEWFTAHGKGINLGYWGKEENHLIAEKLKNVFAEWIDNGHNNFDDENTIILCVELTDGLLLSHGTRYEF